MYQGLRREQNKQKRGKKSYSNGGFMKVSWQGAMWRVMLQWQGAVRQCFRRVF